MNEQREIKFRAFQKPMEGYITDTKMREVLDIRFYDDKGVRCPPFDQFQILIPIENPSENATHAWCSTVNHYVMQFTGLKDKNGKEIYEGDICNARKYSHIEPKRIWKIYEVRWGFVGWLLRGYYNLEHKEEFFSEGFNVFDEIEVIGNIYEHIRDLIVKEVT